jgi:hypothetical protein
MLISYSETFIGAGFIAGEPYYCFEGDFAKNKDKCFNKGDGEEVDVNRLLNFAMNFQN